MKSRTQSNLSMLNSKVMFNSSVFDWKYIFRGKIGQNLLLKMKLGTQSKLSMLNLIMMFCFRPEVLVLGKFCLKIQNSCILKYTEVLKQKFLGSCCYFLISTCDLKISQSSELCRIFEIVKIPSKLGLNSFQGYLIQNRIN